MPCPGWCSAIANRPTELPDPRKHPAIHLTNSIAKFLNIKRVVAGQKNSLALRAQGKTILLASHNPLDIEELCDTVCEMDGGVLSRVR